MAGDTKTATWNLDIRADGKQAAQAAKDLETFRGSIKSSKDAIEEHRIALRNLKGTSDEVKSSREALKQKIVDEQNAIGRSNIAIRKAQTTLEALTKKTKEGAAGHDDLRKAVSAVGGPVADVTGKFETLGGILGGTSPAIAGLVALLALAVVGFVGFAAATIGGTVALAKFTVESGNALRAQGLMREAVTLGADDAARYGRQIDALAGKLATPKEKLNELAVSIRKSFDGTRISGQGIVDTLEAISSASAAAGDDVGNNLKGILDRSKQTGRVGINPQELLGTGGPQFAAIAAALAKNMKVGVAQASAELRAGRVPIDAAAAAIKDAVNTKFGEVNAKKLLDLDVIVAKFHENLTGLAKGALPALEPIFAGLKQMADLFSENTVQGQALQSAITTFATILGASFKSALPAGVTLIKQLINAGLKFGIVMVEVAQKVVDFVHSAAGVATINASLEILKGTAIGAGVVLASVGAVIFAAFAGVGAVFLTIGETVANLYTAGKYVFDAFKAIDWSSLGTAIVDGIKNGIVSAVAGLKSAVGAVATTVKDEFKGALGIHSPSAVFADYGRQTTAGYVQGVERSAPDAHEAVAGMGGGSPGGGGGSSGGSGSPNVSVTFQISGTGSPEKTSALLQSPSVLDGITHAIEVACRGLGIPTQTPVGA